MIKKIIEWFKMRSPKYRYLNLDLNQEAKIRLIKADYDEYNVQFFNPIYKSWWTLPASNAYHGGKWSLLYKGCYGAYDLRKMTSYSVEHARQKFPTLKSIEDYFKSMNREEDRMREDNKRESEKPNVIY